MALIVAVVEKACRIGRIVATKAHCGGNFTMVGLVGKLSGDQLKHRKTPSDITLTCVNVLGNSCQTAAGRVTKSLWPLR